MMQDVGKYMNHQGHHRHTQYIVANSEIFGFSPEQRAVVGAIARYMGKSRPDPVDRILRDDCDRGASAYCAGGGAATAGAGADQDRASAAVRMRTHVYSKRVLLELLAGRGERSWRRGPLRKEADYFREVFRRDWRWRWRRARARCGDRAASAGRRAASEIDAGQRSLRRRTQADAAQASRPLAGQAAAGTRSEPRNAVRLGSWPTTSRFSWPEYSRSSFAELANVASGASAAEVRILAS